MQFGVRRIINSINYRLIGPLTGRDIKSLAARTDFRKTHRTQFKYLKATHTVDEAARMAVGGEFEAVGAVLREALIFHGLKKHHYLIDVGCGSGRLAKPLAKYLDGPYLGIDVVPELLDYARKLVGRSDWRFEPAAGLTIPEQDGKADMVTFFSVLTHLLHEESFVYLKEARRVLKPGGKVVLSFLDYRVADHWGVFESNLRDIGDGSKILNVFIAPDMLREWAKRLDFDVEVIKDGDEPYIPLSEPVRFESGTTWTDRAAFGQSLCVLVRK
jgi:2-polyprenyl-3-methyl-5-hydroxy-6-metoxy-1,4-benzoquinol methylase